MYVVKLILFMSSAIWTFGRKHDVSIVLSWADRQCDICNRKFSSATISEKPEVATASELIRQPRANVDAVATLVKAYAYIETTSGTR